MNFKRTTSLAITATLALTFVFSGVASAATASSTVTASAVSTLSEEKIKLMIAAGEIPNPDMPVEKDVKIKRDEATEIAKAILEDGNKYELGNINLNSNWGSNVNVWILDFYLKASPGGNVNVTVNADTGKIIGFNMWENYNNQQAYVAKFTRDEAVVKATDFITSFLKENATDYELQPENTSDNIYRMSGIRERATYSISFLKKVKGIPVINSNVYISIDATTGKVVGFSSTTIDMDMIKFASAEKVFSTSQILAKYKKSVDFSLQYITVYKNYYGNQKPKIALAYVPSTKINMIDAVTYRSLNYDGTPLSITKLTSIADTVNSSPLNPNAVITSKEISEDEATVIAEKYKTIAEGLLGVSFDQNSSRPYYSSFYGTQDNIWNYNWYKNEGTSNANFSLSISAKTGHITNLNLSKYDYANEIKLKEMLMKEGENATAAEEVEIVENAIDWNQGKEKALEFIKMIAPEQYGFYADQNLVQPTYIQENLKNVLDYNYQFARSVNGIIFRDNNMNVNINAKTGNITNFYFNWNDYDFPDTKSVMAKDEIAKIYFKGIEAKLSYFVPYTLDKMLGTQSFASDAKLVYTMKMKNSISESGLLNAVTGKIIDWNGREVTDSNLTDAANLADGWAKRSVELLLAQGILKDATIAYSTEMTRLDVVKMMSMAKGMNNYYNNIPVQSFTDITTDDENYAYIENAVLQKIITAGGAFNGSEKITKAEFVKLLVNLIGYSDIAQENSIFVLDSGKNVSATDLGKVAICKALEILPVKKGEVYDANTKVTFAEAANALYEALTYVK